MERVIFLLEESNERLGCMLNPETLTIRRSAGVYRRQSIGGQLSGIDLADDPLIFSGGGKTEIQFDLLFDTSLAGSSIETSNVRDLTLPLWNLAENRSADLGPRVPPQVRFLWGKHWDIPGVVVAVAERLERFNANGAPQRSWLRMRMIRVSERLSRGVNGRRPPVAADISDLDREFLADESIVRHAAITAGGVDTQAGAGAAAATDLEFESSPLESSLTAQAIINKALSESTAARALADASNVATGWLDAVSALLDDDDREAFEDEAVEDAGETESESGGEAKESATAGEEEREPGDESLLEAISGASAAVGAIANTTADGLHAAITEAALTTYIAGATAEEVSSDLDGTAEAASAEEKRRGETSGQNRARVPARETAAPVFAQSAAAIAAAVKSEAVDVMAAAVEAIEIAVEKVQPVREAEISAGSEAAQKTVAEMQASIDKLEVAAGRIASDGDLEAVQKITPVLAEMGRALEKLWAAREEKMMKMIEGLVQVSALSAKQALAANEAMTTVSNEKSLTAIEMELQKIQKSLAADISVDRVQKEDMTAGEITEEEPVGEKETQEGEELTSDELSSAVFRIEAQVNGLLPALEKSEMDEMQAELVQLRADIDGLADRPRAASGRSIVERIVVVNSVVERIRHVEASRTTEMIKKSVKLARSLTTTKPRRESAGDILSGAQRSTRVREGERLDQIAFQYYGDPAFWRLLANFNEIDHPWIISSGQVIQIPPSSAVSGTREGEA